MSEIMRRMKALSSTTRTPAGPLDEGRLTTNHSDRDGAPPNIEPDRPAGLAADAFSHHWNARAPERDAAGHDVALAHAHGAGRDQRRKHRRPTYQPGLGAPHVGTVPSHGFDQ